MGKSGPHVGRKKKTKEAGNYKLGNQAKRTKKKASQGNASQHRDHRAILKSNQQRGRA